MVHLSENDLYVIQTLFVDKKWRGAEICRQLPSKKWSRDAVNRAIRRYEATGSTSRASGSGRPATVSTDKNQETVKALAESQESQPGTHDSIRKISRRMQYSKSSVHRQLQKAGHKSLKRLTALQVADGAVQRRLERSRQLLTRFPFWKVKKIIFTDEKDFTLQVPSNRQNNRLFTKGKKSEVAANRLYHPQNKQSVKLMVSAGVSWNGVTKPFFIDPQKSKVNATYYTNYLRKKLMPACLELYPDNDFYFMQDGASSHTSNLCQDLLQETCPRRFITKNQWPPRSPDLNVLDYYFWNAVKESVYEGRREPFKDIKQLQERVKRVWSRSINMESVRKSIERFRPRLQCVVDNEGGPIKQYHE